MFYLHIRKHNVQIWNNTIQYNTISSYFVVLSGILLNFSEVNVLFSLLLKVDTEHNVDGFQRYFVLNVWKNVFKIRFMMRRFLWHIRSSRKVRNRSDTFSAILKKTCTFIAHNAHLIYTQNGLFYFGQIFRRGKT